MPGESEKGFAQPDIMHAYCLIGRVCLFGEPSECRRLSATCSVGAVVSHPRLFSLQTFPVADCPSNGRPPRAS